MLIIITLCVCMYTFTHCSSSMLGSCTYDYRHDSLNYLLDCEHVLLHKCLIEKNNAKIYSNPAM